MAQLFSLGGLSASGVAVGRYLVSEWLDILCGAGFTPVVSGAGTGGSLRWVQAFTQAPIPGSGLVELICRVVVPSPGFGFTKLLILAL